MSDFFVGFVPYAVAVISAGVLFRGLLGILHFVAAKAGSELASHDLYLAEACEEMSDGNIVVFLRKVRRVVAKRRKRPAAAAKAHFQEHFLHIRPDEYFKVKLGTRYLLTRPGSIVYVEQILLDVRTITDEAADALEPRLAVYLTDEYGQPRHKEPLTSILPHDLEPLSKKERKRIADAYAGPISERVPFSDADPVTTLPDVLFGEQGETQAAVFEVHEISGFVDTPDAISGSNLDTINEPEIDEPELELECAWRIYVPNAYTVITEEVVSTPRRLKFYGPVYPVFVPELKQHVPVDHVLLEKREYDREMLELMMPDPKDRARLLRVLPSENPQQLKEWGLDSGLLAGRQNNVVLFIGPPGSGKTRTAEALAEYQGVPLYPESLSDLVRGTEEGLKQFANRIRRWKAVGLLDDAESLMYNRAYGGLEANDVVVATLQQLDSFVGEGILVVATNLEHRLDPGFNSRFPNKFWFTITKEKRMNMWRGHLPDELPLEEGTDKETEIQKLAEIQIDGRQIRDAVGFAGERASNEGLPLVPWHYFREEAEIIREDAEKLGQAIEEYEPPGTYL